MIARKTIHAVLQPHLKEKITEIELIQFPWEEELAEQLQEQYNEDYLLEIQKSIQMWERIDAKIKAKA